MHACRTCVRGRGARYVGVSVSPSEAPTTEERRPGELGARHERERIYECRKGQARLEDEEERPGKETLRGPV